MHIHTNAIIALTPNLCSWPYECSLLSAAHTTTTTTVLRTFVWDYPGEPVPEETLTHPPSWSSSNLISFLHLPWSIAFSLFKLRAWQPFCTTSFHVLFGLPLGLEPSTSYSIHFFIHFFTAQASSLLDMLYKIFMQAHTVLPNRKTGILGRWELGILTYKSQFTENAVS